MINPDDLRTRFPEFADNTEYSDARIEMFICDAIDDMGSVESHWQGEYRYNKALSYLSAHYLVLATDSEYGDTNAKYPIIQKTAGGVSLSYSGLAGASRTDYIKRLSSTTYGQEFLSIRGRSFVGSLVVTQGGNGSGGV
jgi:hypothetical protein